MRMKGIASLLAVASLVLISSCGGGGDSPAASTTITGKLVEGTVDPVASLGAKGLKAAGDPLEGYSLSCVTFSSPPLSASGTAGADGTVTVTFQASSATFGCFVLNADGESVATLIFVNADESQSGQTVTASGSVDVGNIKVEAQTGAAQATTPSGLSIADTPADAACPEGTWLTSTLGHSDSCEEGKDLRTAVWIAKEPSGEYTLSFTTYNVGIYEKCSIGSRSGIPVEIVGNVANFEFPYQFENPPDCPEMVAYAIVTTNEACTSGEVTIDIVNCGTCDPMPSGCGSENCRITGTVTRQ